MHHGRSHALLHPPLQHLHAGICVLASACWHLRAQQQSLCSWIYSHCLPACCWPCWRPVPSQLPSACCTRHLLCVHPGWRLAAVPMLLQMFYAQGLTTVAASAIVTAMALPLAQMQHMHDLGWVALAGTLGMLVSVLVVVGKLLYSFFYPAEASDAAGAAAAAAGAAAHTELFASSSYNVALVGVMDIVFTFGGQVRACYPVGT
jgi:hypothetical protein